MFLHYMYNAQMYAALHTDNSPNVYSKHSVLGLACESTFWLILMQPASVFVLVLHVCVVMKILFRAVEALIVVTELMINRTLCRVKFAKIEYEYELDHVGGTRHCESNESRLFKCLEGPRKPFQALWKCCTARTS